MIKLEAAQDAILYGGKASNLYKLIHGGFNVPGGFVVSTKELVEQIEDPSFRDEFHKQWQSNIPNVGVVRSSSTMEDSRSFSFAGIFESFLNLKDSSAGFEALQQCYIASKSERVQSYTKNTVGDANSNAMAVVVQQQLDAEISGVAFSCDPVYGDSDVFYIEWVFGLGEDLVSGAKIHGRIWASKDGVVLRQDYLCDSEIDIPSNLVKSLVDSIEKAKNLFRCQLDIEWVWANHTLHLVQARPITTTFLRYTGSEPKPWVLPGQPLGGWTKKDKAFFDLWDEYNPRTVYPLDYELYMYAIWDASIKMFDESSNLEPSMFVVLVDSVPISIDPRARLDPTSQSLSVSQVDFSLTEILDRLRNLDAEWECSLIDTKDQSFDELILAVQIFAREYRDAQTIRMRSMQNWIDGEMACKQALSVLLNPLAIDTDKLIEQLTENVSHETNLMNDSFQNLVNLKVSGDSGQVLSDQSSDFAMRYKHFYPNIVEVGKIQQLILDQIDNSSVASYSESHGRYGKSSSTILDSLVDEFDSTDTFDQVCRWVNEYKDWISLRENSKSLVQIPLWYLNNAITKLGDKLVEVGAIQDAQDIAYLTMNEIAQTTINPNFDGNVIVTISQRKKLLKWKQTRSWLPEGFLGRKCRPEDIKFVGLSGGPGIAYGRVVKVANQSEFIRVKNGDIVLAHATDPSWTQLFSRISAIVVENGSRLSHAAIVAREAGIPAVVGIPGLFSVIDDADLVEVNGNEGVVYRIDNVNRRLNEGQKDARTS